MNHHRWIPCFLIAAATIFTAGVSQGSLALAQENPDKQNASQANRSRSARDPLVYRIIPVKERSLDDTLDLAHEISMGVDVTGDEPSNSIVVYGPQSRVEQFEDVMKRLLQASTNDGPEEVLRAFPLGYSQAKQVAGMLYEVIDDLDIAIDGTNQQLLIRGPSDMIAEAERVIGLVDKPRPSLLITFDFLRGYVGEEGEVEVPAPDDLESVVKALSERGVHDLGFTARITATCADGHEFEGMGRRVDGNESTHYEVEGKTCVTGQRDVISVKLSAYVYEEWLEMGPKDNPHFPSTSIGFHLETTVTARLDDAIVLAAAPSGEGGETIVLVMRVSEE